MDSDRADGCVRTCKLPQISDSQDIIGSRKQGFGNAAAYTERSGLSGRIGNAGIQSFMQGRTECRGLFVKEDSCPAELFKISGVFAAECL